LGRQLLQEIDKPPQFDTKVPHLVFSRKPPRNPAPGVEFVTRPVKTFMRTLRPQRGKHIWMMGGGELIASFLDAGLSISQSAGGRWSH
jgi:dihydrofolate reductase